MSDATPDLLAPKKSENQAWFEVLRDYIHEALETLEAEAPAHLYPGEPGYFVREPWTRHDGGGGVMGMMRGRLFEKAGVHCSTVFGRFTPEYAATVPGAEQDPRFYATGVSVIIHPRNPHVPTVHMNLRFIATTQSWFGGGADLTPMLDAYRQEDHPDTVDFHAAMKAACDPYDPEAYSRYKEWAERYFFLPHRNEHRGVGGVFFDHLNSGDYDRDLAFVREVGEAFLKIYPEIVRRNMRKRWTKADRAEQQVRRGRYVEFNLLYDRGTMFGLKTGGNVESILSSMPPTVMWP
ncbi:MAG: oxygen-dependent coproporphyrinogen oxidase [Brevundimonas sp.]|nr:MAG: oxygen-dependent coproporphyrinogen oxidase [Brevundimonas sp.]